MIFIAGVCMYIVQHRNHKSTIYNNMLENGAKRKDNIKYKKDLFFVEKVEV